MSFFRWILGLPFAAVVTVVLFAMMAGLIQQPLGQLPKEKEPLKLEIFAKERSPHKPRPIPPKGIEQDLPETIIPTAPAGEKPKNRVAGPGKTKIKIEKGENTGSFSAPVIKHAPPYPESCRSRAAQGVVMVQFDVTPEGGVVNVQIIETPDTCFNRTVRNAVSRWKYPPAYRDGRSVTRYGVVEQFSFQLTE